MTPALGRRVCCSSSWIRSGNVPLFLSALRHVDPSRYRIVIVRELLIALVILVAFLFVGRYLLGLLHVSPAALTAGGGIILLLIALRMIFPTRERSLREEVQEEPFVVPLAVPYTAGPSMLATELLFMSSEPERWPVWLGRGGAGVARVGGRFCTSRAICESCWAIAGSRRWSG